MTVTDQNAGMADHYAVLGVAREATLDEIKAAYRRLAKQHHPDVNPGDSAAEERFKNVQAAYDVLSDPNKRAAYDRPTPPSFAGGFGGFGGFSNDPFSAFGGFDVMFGRPSGGGAPVRNRNADLEITLAAPAEATLGRFSERLRYTRVVGCPDCGGRGGISTPTDCPDCMGTGIRRSTHAQGNATFLSQSPCGRCKQRGKLYGESCRACEGFGLRNVTAEQVLDAPTGWAGKDLILDGAGNQEDPQQSPGRLIVHLRVAAHPQFRFEGHNLVYAAAVDPVMAILGGEIKVPTLDGGEVSCTVPPGCVHGKRECIQKQGMYFNEADRAALLVDLLITPPEIGDLSNEQLAALHSYMQASAMASRVTPQPTGDGVEGEVNSQ